MIVPAIQGINFLNIPGSCRPAVTNPIHSTIRAIHAIPFTHGLESKFTRICTFEFSPKVSLSSAKIAEVHTNAKKINITNFLL